jgi:hypothetical protein
VIVKIWLVFVSRVSTFARAGVATVCSKARDYVAEVSFVELRVFADLAGEEALAQRAERNEPDAEFLECRYDFGLRFSPPK